MLLTQPSMSQRLYLGHVASIEMYSLLSLARELSDASHSNCCQHLISEWLPRIGRLVEGEHVEDGVIVNWLMFYSRFTSHKHSELGFSKKRFKRTWGNPSVSNRKWRVSLWLSGQPAANFWADLQPNWTHFQLFFFFGFWRRFASKMLCSHLLKQSSSPPLIPFSISHPTQFWLWGGPRLIAPGLPLH